MVSYMSNPQFKVTLGSTVYENSQGISAEIVCIENGFDTATILMNDYQSLIYPNIVTAGTAFQVDVKDYNEAMYTPLSKGIVRFPILPFGENETVRLKCDGAGYGFSDTVCAQEYGTDSRNHTLNTLLAILTDETNGVVPKWVNKVLGSTTNSGFNYDTSNIATITGTIPYLYFPYKPNNKVLDDICDLVTAINAGSAGPHWIVGTDDKLRVKLIDATQTGWTKYYGDSQANATLEQGVDFTKFQFEKMGPEANLIIYNGVLRKPGSGDWCENNASSYDSNIIGYTGECTITNDGAGLSALTADAASGQKIVNVASGAVFSVNDLVYLTEDVGGWEEHIIDSINVNVLTMVNNLSGNFHVADNAKVVKDNVRIGDYSIKSYVNTNGHSVNAYYPSSKNLALNIDNIGSPKSIPILDFYLRLDENCDLTDVELSLWSWTDATHHGYIYRQIKDLITVDKWCHISLPIGTYYKRSNVWDGVEWTIGYLGFNMGDWTKIDLIHIDTPSKVGVRGKMWIDGLSVNGKIVRVAKNSKSIKSVEEGGWGHKLKVKVITDNAGKDDSLVASNDSGLMAKMAYAELLRLQKTSLVGQVTVPMIKDALPGQWFYIHAKKTASGTFNIDTDMRATKIIHTISTLGFFTTLELTDDLTNSHARSPYESINKVWSSIRPEFQDRQATSIKVGEIDIEIPRFEKDYPS